MTQVTPQSETPTQAPVQAVTAPEAAAPQADNLSSKFAALAKKEKWARKLAEDAKREREEMAKEREKYKSEYIPKSRIKENFLEVALENGLTPDAIANILLNQPAGTQVDPTIKEMRAEIEALKAELQQTKSGWQDKEKTQYEQAVAQIKSDAESLLATDAGSFETLKTKPNAADLITQFIEETYKEEGKVLKVEEVATLIENELLEQAVAMAKLKKVQDKLGLTAAPQEPPKPQQIQQQQKTLTNAMSLSSNKTLTTKERRQRAIMRAQGLDPDAASAS